MAKQIVGVFEGTLTQIEAVVRNGRYLPLLPGDWWRLVCATVGGEPGVWWAALAHVVASQTLLAIATTGRMNQTQKFIIDARHQPRYGLIGSCKNNAVLVNMVKVYVPPPAALQDRNLSAAVSGGPKLLAWKTLRDIHWQAS